MTSDDGGFSRDGDDLIDPSQRELADHVRLVLRSPEMRPAFRERLRADVIAARANVIAVRERESGPVAKAPPVLPHEPRPVSRGPRPIARGPRPIAREARPIVHGTPGRTSRRPVVVLGAVAASVLLVASVVVAREFSAGPAPVSVTAFSDVSGNLSADPGASVLVSFSQPLDHSATEAAVHLTPALSVGLSWQGNTLIVAPAHGFAPNSAYLLSIDRNQAKTATGGRLSGDLHVAFGTAPTVTGPQPSTPAASLPRTVLAGAADGSEAVVGNDDSVVLTAALPGPATGYHEGVVRLAGTGPTKFAQAADAVCVSRSGHSIAYLVRGNSSSQVVFADGAGIPTARVAVTADQGSPIGWINDSAVSFVDGGRLRSVDRSGKVTVLSSAPADPARGSVVISQGGGYVYLAPDSSRPGRLTDLKTGASHALPGITGDPAFSADGATVFWIDGSGRSTQLASAASAGGPVLRVPLPVGSGQQVSDLAVSPDGSRLVYSVSGSHGQAQLRLASLPDGDTVAVSDRGAGESPNWAPSGRWFTVLGHGSAGARIEKVSVPASTADGQAQLEAAVSDFANAQLNADRDAQLSMADAGTNLPTLPPVTRAAIVSAAPSGHGTATAQVRLTIDPQPTHPVIRQADETLQLKVPAAGGRPTVSGVSAGPFQPAPAGPQLLHLDTDAAPGAAVLTFDSDLDPASVQTAVKLTTTAGDRVDASIGYDAATRAVTVRPAAGQSRSVVVLVSAGTLRDVAGHTLRTAIRVPITLGG